MTAKLHIVFPLTDGEVYRDQMGPTYEDVSRGLKLTPNKTTKIEYPVWPSSTVQAASGVIRNATLLIQLAGPASLSEDRGIHLLVQIGLFRFEIVVDASTPLVEVSFPVQAFMSSRAQRTLEVSRIGYSPQDVYPDDVNLAGIEIKA